ncbi:ATP-binding cassette sub-family C member 4-like isoform X2 [Halichondria panicea]|uniref:ATP-binding cassette sub-family C member 4-like isoform X2 n=1 Tax=Halichondria panicea TaxID=6063 RepID=UPI00312B65B3
MADSQAESKTVSSEEEEGWDRRFGKGGHSAVGGGVSEKKDPRPKYNILSWLLFLWLEPLLWHGMRHGVTRDNLYPHPSETDSQKLLQRFNRYWAEEMLRKESGKKPRLMLTLIRCMPWRVLVHSIFYFMETVLLVSQSVLLGYLTETIGNAQDPYLLGAGLVLCALLVIFIHAHNYLLGYKLGMISRTLMTAVIYQKVTTLSQVSIGKLSVGHIVNLASNDVQKFELAFLHLPVVWIIPITWSVLTYIAYLEVGWSAFTIIGFILVLTPLQLLLAKVFSKLRHKSALVTDKRIRIMNEVISGMKVIKMYAWEFALKAVISKLRRGAGNPGTALVMDMVTRNIFGGLLVTKTASIVRVSMRESFIILQSATIRAIGLSLILVSVPIVSFTLFSVYTAIGGILTPKKVFTTLSLIILLKLDVYAVVNIELAISEGLVAISRISKFLAVKDSSQGISNCPANDDCMESFVLVENMSASWGDTPVLENISIKLTKASPLLTVFGSVGSGKSTLLQVLLSELQPSSGRVNINGRLSYTSQEPWLFSASLRDNILFGNEYDPVRYNAVIDACALKKDIIQLVNDDLTLVGERGVTLSGGQKARVSLARAIYHQADIYLLDDPFSAVDTAVAKHIFDRCIKGLLAAKLVILVTHQVQFALRSDQLLGLKERGVEVYGEVNELQARNVNLKQLLGLEDIEELHASELDNDGKAYVSSITREVSDRNKPSQKSASDATGCVSYKYEPSLFSVPSLYSLHSEISIQQLPTKVNNLSPEERSYGSISFTTYVKYFQAGGNALILMLMVLLFIFGEGGLVACDWWISDWAQCYQLLNETFDSGNRTICLLSTNERISTFAGLLAGTILLNFIKIVLFSSMCVNASRVLHNQMLDCILHTPMLFFDTNPIGRILNRFSKDVGFLDDLLPYIFSEYMIYFCRMWAVVVTAIVGLPWLLIPCVVLLPLFLALRWYYLKTVRDIKRLEGLGLPVIRSFGKTAMSVKQFHDYQNEHTKAYYAYQALTRWLGVRLDLIVILLLASVVFIAPSLSTVFDPALIGLALTYTLSLAQEFQYSVRLSADVESTMVATERIIEYSDLRNEASFETVPIDKKPSSDWPSNGCLMFENVAFQYSPNLPFVLKSVCFAIRQAEKIGVVGRTGAGKSSLLSVLFRLAEPSGRITIDGVDILSIGLHDIRSKMSIIPQDPVLFSGTMRYNLDPFNKFSDNELWDVLEQVQLKSTVQQLEGQLAGEVLEGGSNFSVGQKQLVCLARAMMKKNKILILDEATANVDLRTDEIIQQTIRQKCSECTIITIAHRLNTIMNSDRILVLDNGEVLEFDTPFNLLKDPKSLLSEMIRVKTAIS